MSIRLLVVICLAVPVAVCMPASGQSLPDLPGYTVTVYAPVVDPVNLTFDPNGALFTGRGSIEGTIRRIGPGGSPVEGFGPVLIDADGVLVDADGRFSGVPGAVLVASGAGGVGTIWAIEPDESASAVFGPTPAFRNPGAMLRDLDGRLLIGDIHPTTMQVLASAGGFPQTLINSPAAPFDLAVDHLNRLFVSYNDGTIAVHDASGLLLDQSFTDYELGTAKIAFGPGGVWGTSLYAVTGSGEFVNFDSAGLATVLGNGFGATPDLEFGPDGALYASDASDDRILRITQCPGDVDESGVVNVTDLVIVVTFWGPTGVFPDADTDDDGQVDVNDLVAVITQWGPCP